jgi:cytochrome b561
MPVSRYHPVLVALHWLIGLMIIFNLGFGFFVIRNLANSDPQKLSILAGHMGVGTAVIVLMVIRLITRLFTSHPAPTAHQQQGLGTLRTPMHWALYAVVFITAIAGWLTGAQIAHLYETPGNTLPADFPSMTTRVIHVWMTLLLFLLILAHIAAAARERMLGDKTILQRMWFGKRQS